MAAGSVTSTLTLPDIQRTTRASETEGPAQNRLLRLFSRFVSFGYVAYFVLSVPAIHNQAGLVAAWWTPVAVAVVWLPAVAMGLCSWRKDTAWVRQLAAVTSLAYLFAPASWLLLWSDATNHLTEVDAHWLASFPGMASLAAALVWRPVWVFAHLTVVTSLAQVTAYLARGNIDVGILVVDTVFGVAFSAMFVAATVMALRTGRILDEVTVVARRRAAGAAAAEARSVERERFDALIHDGVLSTLLGAATSGATPLLGTQANLVLKQIDTLRTPAAGPVAVASDEAVALIRASIIEVDETIHLRTEFHPDAESLMVPADVARAMAAALAEAVRNSLRHASSVEREARRWAEVTVDTSGLCAEAHDDGVGFDQHAVAPNRMGLAVSVHGRMRQIPGATARVTSAPGAGTTVTLTWRVTP